MAESDCQLSLLDRLVDVAGRDVAIVVVGVECAGVGERWRGHKVVQG